MTRTRTILATTALAALAACSSKPPSGQVVARVNGTEITRSQLDAEMAAANVPAQLRTKVQPLVLQQIVDRTLFAQAAQKAGVDKDPEFLIQQKRADDMMLIQRYLRRTVQQQQTPPSDDAVAAYLAAHPEIGDQRVVYTMDRIRFPLSSDPAFNAGLRKIKSADELMAFLRARNVPAQRDQGQVPSDQLPPPAFAKIKALAPGEPLIQLGAGQAIAFTVLNSAPAPLSSDVATALAKQRMGSEKAETAIKREEQALRSEAKIEYADGMAPPPAKPGAPANPS